jgi:hypothetical protein
LELPLSTETFPFKSPNLGKVCAGFHMKKKIVSKGPLGSLDFIILVTPIEAVKDALDFAKKLHGSIFSIEKINDYHLLSL